MTNRINKDAFYKKKKFPVVSLDLLVTHFLPTAPWPWGRLSP